MRSDPSIVEVTRPRAEWQSLLASVEQCHTELFWLDAAYKDSHDDVRRIQALEAFLRSALERRGDPLSIRASREFWLRAVSAFRVGVEDMEGRFAFRQTHPDYRSSTDVLAFPRIRADWLSFLAALPSADRDTHRVCDACDRLFPTAEFADARVSTGYRRLCRDCDERYTERLRPTGG